MSVHSIQPPDGPSEDSNTLIIKDWEFHYSDAMLGIWGIAEALKEELVNGNNDKEVSQCLAIALVNLATQLKHSH